MKQTVLNVVYRCQNCDNVYEHIEEIEQVIKDLHQRVAPGEKMPAGECPACGALVHIEENHSQEKRMPAGECPACGETIHK